MRHHDCRTHWNHRQHSIRMAVMAAITEAVLRAKTAVHHPHRLVSQLTVIALQLCRERPDNGTGSNLCHRFRPIRHRLRYSRTSSTTRNPAVSKFNLRKSLKKQQFRPGWHPGYLCGFCGAFLLALCLERFSAIISPSIELSVRGFDLINVFNPEIPQNLTYCEDVKYATAAAADRCAAWDIAKVQNFTRKTFWCPAPRPEKDRVSFSDSPFPCLFYYDYCGGEGEAGPSGIVHFYLYKKISVLSPEKLATFVLLSPARHHHIWKWIVCFCW